MKNKYEIIAENDYTKIAERVNELLAEGTNEICFIGGVTRGLDGIFIQAILQIPKQNLPAELQDEVVVPEVEQAPVPEVEIIEKE